MNTLPSLICDEDLEAMTASASMTPHGCFVEVGVYRGGSAERLYGVAQDQGRKLFLYDTFEGIPCHDDALDVHEVGEFACDNYADIIARLPEAVTVRGVFPSSAVTMPDVAFAHIDCDQYHSVKQSLYHLWQIIVPGGMIWLDDAPTLRGAKAAADEFMSDRDDYDFRAISGHYTLTRRG